MSTDNCDTAGQKGQWTTGLCGCFEDVGNCFLTCFCPCITFGRNVEIVEKGETSCAPGAFIFYMLGFVGCSSVYSCGFRTKLRKQYSLPEEPCGDCVVHLFCTSCALCQEHRELQNRGFYPSIGWAANADRKKAPSLVSGMSRETFPRI